MKYVFPGQFHLHNVFTSEVSSRDTAQRFKDYTTREEEILKSGGKKNHLPRRLRGRPFCLISKLRKRHSNCPYAQLFQYYCPARETASPGQNLLSSKTSERSLIELACSSHNVSAFCRAVIKKVIPSEAWGVGEGKLHNEKKIMHSIDRFIKMRKFESPTLLEVIEGIKVSIHTLSICCY